MTTADPIDIWKVLNESERKEFVNQMIKEPSLEWLELIHLAEAKEIPNSKYINSRSSELYESIAPLIADEDGLVEVVEKKGGSSAVKGVYGKEIKPQNGI